MDSNRNVGTTLVWDLPTRIFHWGLALSFVGAFATAEADRWRDLHAMLGYTTLVLVAFRLAWGVVGTRHARFTSFPFSLRRGLGYLWALAARRAPRHLGHNPAGALAIYALLALAIAAAGSGLWASGGGHWPEEAHEAIANGMLAVVLVHVAGVLVGSFAHRENLVRSMLTGRKRAGDEPGADSPHRLAAIALIAVIVGLWVGIVPAPGLERQQTLIGVTTSLLAPGHAWREDD